MLFNNFEKLLGEDDDMLDELKKSNNLNKMKQIKKIQ